MLLALALFPSLAAPVSEQEATQARDLITRCVEVNRYWLLDTPPAVRNFSYTLQRIGGTQKFDISNPKSTSRARLRGMTYSSLLQHLARSPKSSRVSALVREGDRWRISFEFDPAVRGAIGNGVENSWNGYHSFSAKEGYLVIDAARFTPVEAGLGRLRETFGDYVRLDETHYAPLAIRLDYDDTTYQWRFRVYAPGLWLFDDSHFKDRRVAWIENVLVNQTVAHVQHATQGSLEAAALTEQTKGRVHTFLDANRAWLNPATATRAGLVYDYRQEPPYHERVWFAKGGAVMAQLQSEAGNPTNATRQVLWLPDGRFVRANASDEFVAAAPPPNSDEEPASARLLQHLKMGLALDCAVTRLSRRPDAFRVEYRPGPEPGKQYTLVLRPNGDARLFTGTMLAFTSHCYMHDVRYDRSEIVCDAATHRPLEESTFEQGDLKGRYTFSDWMSSSSGQAPGRIQAYMPFEIRGKKSSLSMDARFGWANAAAYNWAESGIWLLKTVSSSFADGSGASTGTVALADPTAADVEPLALLTAKVDRTAGVLERIRVAPQGFASALLTVDQPLPLALQAKWTEKARSYLVGDHGVPLTNVYIGVYEVNAKPDSSGSFAVELRGVSTAAWKEFLVNWAVRLLEGNGRVVSETETNALVRAESSPQPINVLLKLAAPTQPTGSRLIVGISGNVERMTAAYHGHGMWMQLAKQD